MISCLTPSNNGCDITPVKSNNGGGPRYSHVHDGAVINTPRDSCCIMAVNLARDSRSTSREDLYDVTGFHGSVNNAKNP